MASLPSVMSLGDSSLLIGTRTHAARMHTHTHFLENLNAAYALIFILYPVGLTPTQPQTVPVINNVGGGFTTLQPITFQQQLHAAPQQPITQQLPSHMTPSPFMATMTPLPCHSK